MSQERFINSSTALQCQYTFNDVKLILTDNSHTIKTGNLEREGFEFSLWRRSVT